MGKPLLKMRWDNPQTLPRGVAETVGFWVYRKIAGRPDSSYQLLNEQKPSASVVIRTAGMNAIVKPLRNAEINIHYIYTTIDRLGKETILILGVDKVEEATAVLKQHWINFVGDKIYSL